jgi:hypothetical protein
MAVGPLSTDSSQLNLRPEYDAEEPRYVLFATLVE